MATIATLAQQGLLEQVQVALESELPCRAFYGSPRFIAWLRSDLPTRPADLGGRLSPADQVEELLYQMVAGHQLLEKHDLRLMRPFDECVWELKTTDVRIFGWFPIRDVFIAVCGDMARRIKDVGLYHGYQGEVIWFREHLDLDQPKHLQGRKVSDVLSF